MIPNNSCILDVKESHHISTFKRKLRCSTITFCHVLYIHREHLPLRKPIPQRHAIVYTQQAHVPLRRQTPVEHCEPLVQRFPASLAQFPPGPDPPPLPGPPPNPGLLLPLPGPPPPPLVKLTAAATTMMITTTAIRNPMHSSFAIRLDRAHRACAAVVYFVYAGGGCAGASCTRCCWLP
jgi:hypothetical protein